MIGLCGLAILAAAFPITDTVNEMFFLDIFIAKLIAMGIGSGFILYGAYEFNKHKPFND